VIQMVIEPGAAIQQRERFLPRKGACVSLRDRRTRAVSLALEEQGDHRPGLRGRDRELYHHRLREVAFVGDLVRRAG
jgi:hypothetical protein